MTASKWHALVVDDDPGVQQTIVAILDQGGFACQVADSGGAAYEALQDKTFDLLIIDRKLPDTDGVRLLGQIRSQGIKAPALVVTGHPSVSTAIKALQALACDYLTKPCAAEELLSKARRAVQGEVLVGENDYLWRSLATKYGWQHVMSRNRETQRAYVTAAKAAPTGAPVLIEGQTGTGKEYLARAIHYMSDRADKPLVTLNCGGFPDELLENELFGHEKGAYTSAHAAKAGLCELADGGTLFLDEIGHMSPAMQVKLLRFVEDHCFTRLGGVEPRTVDVRLIAASNQHLPEMVAAGGFREDLYYRLNVIPLVLPALCERPEDLEPFAEHFRVQFDVGGKKQLGPSAWAKLKAHTWPGNLRELRNVIQRAMVLADGNSIEAEDLRLDVSVAG